MKNLEVALCDSDEDYILKFASYLMDQNLGSIHVFTSSESFFSDEGCYDIAILSQDFKEVSDFRPNGTVGRKYFLSENQDDISDDNIYKYQAVNCILDNITEFKLKKNLGVSAVKSNTKSKTIGVYSPICHELQLPFSMALGQGYRNSGRVLFLDLEEISIMPELVGVNCEKNLMDLLYEIDTNTKNLDLSAYVKTFMGFDYIEPFLNPNEISEINSETWNKLFELLGESGYDVIVILFGRTINGFGNYIANLDKLYVLGKAGDYFRKTQDAFNNYVGRSGLNIDLENVVLPMSAGNLSDNAYQIEELLQGNLGTFVKKLINDNRQSAKELYG